MKYEEFDVLKGKTLTSVTGGVGDDRMEFETSDGDKFLLFHVQDCCECVSVEDIAGDIADIIGSPIEMAEESTNSKDDPPPDADCFTWTFYKLATAKGYVTIRWLGKSNGYYSESVYFERVANPTPR